MARDEGRVGEALRRGLPALGIRSAYLCRYEGGGAEGEAILVAGFRDGEAVAAPSPAFPAAELLPHGAFPERRLAYVVEPLFFHDSAIGYALFEIGDAAGSVYERLRDSVSDALRSLILFERAEEARLRAERADAIKTRLLGNVTHELRAPVDAILLGAQRLRGLELASVASPSASPSDGSRAEVLAELERITRGAEHERRLVGDLLDFSRAEIDELDIERRLVDPAEVAREAFSLFAPRAREGVEWRLELPERLPLVLADPFRLKQILVNLLSNAEKFTVSGEVTLSMRAEPPDLAIRVSDTGRGIGRESLAHLFEPFLSSSPGGEAKGGSGGVGLGLSIARHLARLHFGSLEAESPPGGGATFTLALPLPDARSLADGARAPTSPTGEPCLVLVSAREVVPPDIAAAAAARGLALRRIGLKEAEAGALDGLEAAAIAWDSASAGEEERALFRKIRKRPRLASLPFLLYGPEKAASAFLDKATDATRLAEAFSLALGPGEGGKSRDARTTIVAADDDERALSRLVGLLAEAFPGAEVRAARDGAEAWDLLRDRRPALAVLDIAMPRMSGIEVAKLMRADARLRSVPTILLTSKVISMEDVRALEGSPRVILRNKGVLSAADESAEAARTAAGEGRLQGAASDLARRAVAFINERYGGALARWQIAEAVNASEDHLSRVFRRELGVSPWDYLTRLRVERAKELLASSSESVAAIGARVGFPDQAYFSRVFKKIAGIAPQAFRDSR
jgi:signal transduction histidine kinase/AraC-like DNA-binding protein